MNALINVTYYDFKTYQEDSYILFKDTIIEIGKMEDYENFNYQEIDCSNQIVMPGLVNGHSHIYSTFARGMSVPFNPNNFQELLEQLWWKLDRNLTNEMNYYSGIVSGVEYIKNGVTTIIDHHASAEIQGSLNSLKKALNEVGVRGIYCFESSDRFDIDQCIKENNTFIKENNDSFNRGLFGMHAAFTLNNESLTKIKKQTKGPIHIHVAESKMDQDISIKKYNKRVIERLHSFDLIRKNSILTHCLYLNKSEYKIIKENQAVIALNVNSNMNNAVGLPDYQAMKKHGIKVIIGNDGLSQNITSEYHSLYYTMHSKTKDPLGFGLDDLKRIINDTYDYANDILETKIGTIEKGYESDLIILDFNKPTPVKEENILGHLFFGLFHDFKPNHVFVGGKQLLENKQVDKELQNTYNQSSSYAQLLWDKIEKEGNL